MRKGIRIIEAMLRVDKRREEWDQLNRLKLPSPLILVRRGFGLFDEDDTRGREFVMKVAPIITLPQGGM